MTVSTTTCEIEYVESAGATYPVPFRFLAATDLVVTRTVDGAIFTLTFGGDYTVSGADAELGGSITRITAASIGAKLRIERRTAVTQPTNYTDGDRFPAESHERALDRVTMIAQEQEAAQARLAGRALLVREGQTIGALPDPSALAGNVLGFDEAGTPVAGPRISQLLEIIGAIFNPIFTQLASLVLFTLSAAGAVVRSVADKLAETPSIKDFGAVGDGIADEADALEAAFAAHDTLKAPPGIYNVSRPLRITNSRKRLRGSGIDITIIRNTGSGHAIEFTSGGGANPTLLNCELSDLTIDGGNVGKGLYLYDIAQSRFRRVKAHRSTANGIQCEMAVDCTLEKCISIENAGIGILLSDALKAGLEYNTNAVDLRVCITYGNAIGVSIARSRGNRILGGDHSANPTNILLDGGERNTIRDAWIENATTRAIKIQSSTSALGTVYAGSYNVIVDNMISTGAGSIEVASGDGNFFEGNYLGVNMTIGASATLTYLGQQTRIAGTITDNGSGTVGYHNPTAQYVKRSGAKRYQLNIGTTVDITSDIQSIRIGQMLGLSKTSTLPNNFNNFVDISGSNTSATVTFGTAEPDAAYSVFFGVWDVAGAPAANSHIAYMTGRAISGFTVNLVQAPGAGATVRVSWMLVR